jgi:hypothetical protein
LIRADAGGASHWFAEECVDRNLKFSFGFHIDHRVRDGVMCIPTGCWHHAIDGNGEQRDGAEVAESTEVVDLDSWPDGTRLIVRRERPHPGAQLSLFDTIEGFRHTAFITNQPTYDIVALELQQRQRTRAKNVIRDTKACGLSNLPFDDIVSNEAWMNLCFSANDLLSWAQRIGCTGQLRRATPKTIRPPVKETNLLDRSGRVVIWSDSSAVEGLGMTPMTPMTRHDPNDAHRRLVSVVLGGMASAMSVLSDVVVPVVTSPARSTAP